MDKKIEVTARASFAEFPDFVKKLADKGLETLKEVTSVTTLMAYDLGRLVHELTSASALDDTKKKSAVQQVAACWSTVNPALTTSVLYSWRQVATSFKRDWFIQQIQQPKKDGSLLTFSHFRELQKVKDMQEIQEILKTVRQENLSQRELRQRIASESKAKVKRSGGRKVKIPASPQEVMQKMTNFLHLTTNFAAVIDDAWVEKAKVSKEPQLVLENLNKALQELDKFALQAAAAKVRLHVLQAQLTEAPVLVAAKPAVKDITAVVKKRGRPKKSNV